MPKKVETRGRKPAEDRTTVASVHLGMRVTVAEHVMAGALAALENEALEQMGLPRASSTTSVIRRLIVKEAKEKGISVSYNHEGTAYVVLNRDGKTYVLDGSTRLAAEKRLEKEKPAKSYHGLKSGQPANPLLPKAGRARS